MAIQMSSVVAGFSAKNVEAIERGFDERILEASNSPEGLRGDKWEVQDRPGYTKVVFIVLGSVSSQDKIELKNRYTEAGWDVGEVRNSDDAGERPGLVAIEFYLKD